MSAVVWTARADHASAADTALQLSARIWFAAAVLGQWLFLAYVVAFYRGATAALAGHLALGVIVMGTGPLQFVPWIRRHAPALHRVNGRVYVVTVILASISGLQMMWSRPGPIRIVQNAGVTIDALLIVLFAALAVRHAMKRNLGAHRRWALRLFMVVNAGWFFRVGMMQSLFLERRPVEPFLNFLAYADYLLPLALLELYLRAKERGSVAERFALAAVVCALTVVMVAGIAVATKTVWLPRTVAGGAAR